LADPRLRGCDQRRHGVPARRARPRLHRGLHGRGRHERRHDGRGRLRRGAGNRRADPVFQGSPRRTGRPPRPGIRPAGGAAATRDRGAGREHVLVVSGSRERRPRRDSRQAIVEREVSDESTSGAGPELVLATGNRVKAREIAALLDGLPCRIVDLGAFPGILMPPEGETSYTDNALGKVRAVSKATGRLALADDSGIEVDALEGRPGVLSARFGGEALSDEERNGELLRALSGVPADRRGARYRSVIALCDPRGREA